MEEVSYSYLRQHLSKLLNGVIDNSEVLHVKRRKGQRVVVIEEREYENMLETLHVFSTEANTRRILKGLQEAKQGKGVEIDLQSYFNS